MTSHSSLSLSLRAQTPAEHSGVSTSALAAAGAAGAAV
eukprot:CAMPEP_0202922590 /NCGR_PEP_ID=MMETSP1392-20130828/77998_1 /ASSEMBLY_ACC=CAM_ASM_000868 /TAXON_ID=225041 /ORGANISM="Chlamydomonas chlamydogama, Strain SAG 11-48b" /LENGTH=37 /DNA_ID= /DNA_START= /DNA_END= /DNA_ORIENTATION=